MKAYELRDRVVELLLAQGREHEAWIQGARVLVRLDGTLYTADIRNGVVGLHYTWTNGDKSARFEPLE